MGVDPAFSLVGVDTACSLDDEEPPDRLRRDNERGLWGTGGAEGFACDAVSLVSTCNAWSVLVRGPLRTLLCSLLSLLSCLVTALIIAPGSSLSFMLILMYMSALSVCSCLVAVLTPSTLEALLCCGVDTAALTGIVRSCFCTP